MAAEKKTSPLEKLDRQSLTSLGLGTLVVIIIGLLIFNYFSKIKQAPPLSEEVAIEEVTEEKILPEEEEQKVAQEAEKPSFEFQPTKLPADHTVLKNEHLWGLAKRYYNDGYQWVKIAQENKLTNANIVLPGQVLKIPDQELVKKPEEKVEEKIESLGDKIEGQEYTVQEGDSLCKIGLRAYGECTQGWKVAEANNLTNPHLIYPGTVLKIPRG